MIEEASPQGENAFRADFISTFGKEAQIARSEMGVLSDEEWNEIQEVIGKLGLAFPEGIIVGGVALRLHLQQREQPIPHRVGVDIDIEVPQKQCDEIGMIFSTESSLIEIQQLLLDNFRYIEEHNFTDAEGQKRSLTLEDMQYGRRVDVFFSNGLETTELALSGQTIHAASLEELFLKRYEQLRSAIDSNSYGHDGETEDLKSADAVSPTRLFQLSQVFFLIPKTMVQYFYLNGELIDDDRLEKLAKSKGYEGNIIEDILSFYNKLNSGIKFGAYILV